MGNLISNILSYFWPRHEQAHVLSTQKTNETFFLDSAIRQKAEKNSGIKVSLGAPP